MSKGPCIPGKGSLWQGYSRQMRAGTRRSQHAWAWADAYGEIPDGHVIHHECENKACVNVEHLRAMPRGDHTKHHLKKDYCKNGHRREGNTTKAGNCRTCMREYLKAYKRRVRVQRS